MSTTLEHLDSLSDEYLTSLAHRLLSKLRLPRYPDGSIRRDRPWLWKLDTSLDKDGYPKITVASPLGKRSIRAHRVAFYLLHRTLPDQVLHQEPVEVVGPDCNPYRLRAGTALLNAGDRNRQDRTARGSRNGAATLDESTVHLIKRDLAAGMGIRPTARKHGATPGAVGAIASDRTWKHVAWPTSD